jgi:hypothetical protein
MDEMLIIINSIHNHKGGGGTRQKRRVGEVVKNKQVIHVLFFVFSFVFFSIPVRDREKKQTPPRNQQHPVLSQLWNSNENRNKKDNLK